MSRTTRVKGGRTETQSAGETDEDPPLDTTSERVPPDRSQDPASCITYPEYCFDMVILSRFVSEEGYPQIARPDKYPLPNSEVLREKYREQCYVLDRLAAKGQADNIFTTLDRWNVAPETLREVPHPEDLRKLFRVEKLARVRSIQQVDGFGCLGELSDLFVMMDIAWKGNEPVEFWLEQLEQHMAMQMEKAISQGHTPSNFPVMQRANDVPVAPRMDGPFQSVNTSTTEDLRSFGSQATTVEVKVKKEPQQDDKSGVQLKPKSGDRHRAPRASYDGGTDETNAVRVDDMLRVQWLMEQHLARYLTAVLQTCGRPLGHAKLKVIRTLAEQAYDEAMFGKALTRFPLSRTSFFRDNPVLPSSQNQQCALVWNVPRVSDPSVVANTRRFKETRAYWRVLGFVGRQSDGFLGDKERRHWLSIFESYAKDMLRIISFCDQQLDKPASELFDTSKLRPNFRLDQSKHWEVDHQGNSCAFSDVEDEVDDGDSEGGSQDADDHEAKREKLRTPESQKKESQSQQPTTAQMMSGYYMPYASREHVSDEEFSAEWLSVFSAYSIVNPPKFKTTNNQRGESDMLKTISKLKEVNWSTVLQLVDQLKQFHGSFKDAVVPWNTIIDPALEAMILVCQRALFPNYIVASLSGLSSKMLVKILGRLCEASDWQTFQVRALDVFNSLKIVVDSNSRSVQLQVVQRVLLQLLMLVPLFGRRLGLEGAYLHSRECSFCQFLKTILPYQLIAVLLDRIYAPNAQQLEKNENFGLPKDYREWQWALHVSPLLVMIQNEVACEAEVEKRMEDRMLMYRDTTSSPPRAASRTHSMMHDDDDDVGDEIPVFAGFELKKKSAHPFGRSGSGTPTPQLDRLVERSERAQREGRFQPGICFDHAEDPTSCKRGVQCKYRHLDATNPEEAALLIAHFRSKQQRSPSRVHVLEEGTSCLEHVDSDGSRVGPVEYSKED